LLTVTATLATAAITPGGWCGPLLLLLLLVVVLPLGRVPSVDVVGPVVLLLLGTLGLVAALWSVKTRVSSW
jgi:hypothetical protein